MQRKGSLQDVVALLKVIPGVVLSLWIAGKLWTAISSKPQLSGVAMERAGAALQTMDYAILSIMVVFFVASVILAIKIPAHPAALPVSFIFLAIVVYVGGMISNVWVTIAATENFQNVVGLFPVAELVILHFPKILGVLGMVIIFVQYSSGGPKRRRKAL